MYGDIFMVYDQENIDDICKKDASGVIEIIILYYIQETSNIGIHQMIIIL